LRDFLRQAMLGAGALLASSATPAPPVIDIVPATPAPPVIAILPATPAPPVIAILPATPAPPVIDILPATPAPPVIAILPATPAPPVIDILPATPASLLDCLGFSQAPVNPFTLSTTGLHLLAGKISKFELGLPASSASLFVTFYVRSSSKLNLMGMINRIGESDEYNDNRYWKNGPRHCGALA
jgi:hypothetical protein